MELFHGDCVVIVLFIFGVLVSSIYIVPLRRFTNLLMFFLNAFLNDCVNDFNKTVQKTLKTLKNLFVFKNSVKSFLFWVWNGIFHNFDHSFQQFRFFNIILSKNAYFIVIKIFKMNYIIIEILNIAKSELLLLKKLNYFNALTVLIDWL